MLGRNTLGATRVATARMGSDLLIERLESVDGTTYGVPGDGINAVLQRAKTRGMNNFVAAADSAP